MRDFLGHPLSGEKAGEPNQGKERALKELLSQTSAVLFDLDGTLVDSMWMWTEIDIAYLGSLGKTFSPSLQKEIEGMSFTETAVYFKEQFQIPDSIEEIKAAWIRMSLERYAHEVPLKPYAMEFLKLLRKRGILTGIATSNYLEMADACIDALSIRPYLDVICTACEVERGKPSPDIYLYAAKKLKQEPKACLVFEDIPAGIQAGKAAGMTVVAVDDAFSRDQESLKRELSDYFISDFSIFL